MLKYNSMLPLFASIVGRLFTFLLNWYVWMPIVIVLVYLTWRNYEKVNSLTATNVDNILLLLEIPKTNDKSELAAEQMFASLHGILRDQTGAMHPNQEHLSFEIASVNGQIRFYVCVPRHLQNFVEGQIYAQYPTVQIKVADDDYTTHTNRQVIYTTDLNLTDVEFLPIKTFDGFDVDPLAGITGTLAKLEDSNEELWVQLLIRPIADDWHKQAESWIEKVRSGTSMKFRINWQWIGSLVEALWQPPEGDVTEKTVELSERDKSRVSEAEKKANKLGYRVKIQLAYLGGSQENAHLRMQALVGTFKQFNSTNLNGFTAKKSSFDEINIDRFQKRSFAQNDGFILNIEELASVYHLPHTNVETPNIVWATSKTAEPPAKLPVLRMGDPVNPEVSAFGLTNFRGVHHQFGMLRRDRSRHLYIIGQTGAGKSGTLELLALSDIYHDQGYAIIDPHGDFAINNMKFIPERRIKDVVYFNPADTAFPVGFNPLEVTHLGQRILVASEVIGVLKRMFGDSWGPRLEHILRFTLLALLERPGTTMLDITRMLTDKEFRKETLNYVNDAVVLQFWKKEFASWNEKYETEAVAPVLNKVGAFTANSIIRNIIGQPKSTFNIRQIMDEGKILVVNLSRGLIGEDNAAILGSFLVTKIQLAAMSRADIPNVNDRKPFYLYVDEFQNFATDSFATILSEARKYGLSLTVANQYIAQMQESVRDAVFGNVGSIISFRVSADDAPILAKQFEPQFEAQDLLSMHNRHFIISMIISGEKQTAFSATTLNLPEPRQDFSAQIIEWSRKNYSRSREEVEEEIQDTIKIPEQFDTPSRRRYNEARQGKGDDSPRPPFDPKKISPNAAPWSGGGGSNQQPERKINTNQLKDLKAILAEETELKVGDKSGDSNEIQVITSNTKRQRKPRRNKQSRRKSQ